MSNCLPENWSFHLEISSSLISILLVPPVYTTINPPARNSDGCSTKYQFPYHNWLCLEQSTNVFKSFVIRQSRRIKWSNKTAIKYSKYYWPPSTCKITLISDTWRRKHCFRWIFKVTTLASIILFIPLPFFSSRYSRIPLLLCFDCAPLTVQSLLYQSWIECNYKNALVLNRAGSSFFGMSGLSFGFGNALDAASPDSDTSTEDVSGTGSSRSTLPFSAHSLPVQFVPFNGEFFINLHKFRFHSPSLPLWRLHHWF